MQDMIEALKKEHEIWITKAKALEAQSKEAFHNAEHIQETIRLIRRRETASTEPELFLTKKVSDKYKDMSMPASIEDILKNEPDLNGNEIFQRLEQNGFQSESKNLKRDVYTRLFRLATEGKINAKVRKDGIRRYTLPEHK